MRWHEFIFSERTKYKVMRHFAFWATWWLYFSFSYLLLQQPIPGLGMKPFYLTPGDHYFLKTFLLILLFVISCYPLIYYLFPQVNTGKWMKAIAFFFVICLFLFIASYFLYWNIFAFIDSSFGTSKAKSGEIRSWPPVSLGLINFIKVSAAAISIKYVKYWWQKQKEGQLLEKGKINAELQLLKAQVHPDFLFKTLNSIYSHAQSSSPRASDMLLKLSDLLSYMLYECDGPTVALEKEITMMKEYMLLEKIRYNDAPELQVNIKGDLNSKSIAPFLLLPFIENSFRHCSQMTEQFWINMDIRIDGDNFSMKLTNGISENSIDKISLDINGLANVQKRLSLLYPGNHELRVTTAQEMFIVLLNIRLSEYATIAIKDEETDSITIKGEPITTPF